ncbi:DNA-directed RNA polymerase subunit omega [candidate division KSB1 bacterium]|nr:DNA-directed RNA polymerase subunit omega [candidate division KSB1 bacterium]
MSKVSLDDLMQDKRNIYETVVVMSKRSRQVIDEQKRLIDKDRDNEPQIETRDTEEFEDVEIDREALMREYTKYPKPSRVAMNEMVADKIKWEFPEKSESSE